MAKRKISIIGSTGSIGRQALEVLEKLQDKYYVINRRKNNVNSLDENAELVSEPLYHGENVKNIFGVILSPRKPVAIPPV